MIARTSIPLLLVGMACDNYTGSATAQEVKVVAEQHLRKGAQRSDITKLASDRGWEEPYFDRLQRRWVTVADRNDTRTVTLYVYMDPSGAMTRFEVDIAHSSL